MEILAVNVLKHPDMLIPYIMGAILWWIIATVSLYFIWTVFTKSGKQFKKYMDTLPEDNEDELNRYMPSEFEFEHYKQRNREYKAQKKK